MDVSVDVRNIEGVRDTVRDLGRAAPTALVSSINRTARDLRSRVVRKTTEIYNISRLDLTPFVSIRRASRNKISGQVSLLIRAIPIEFFRPRVKMQVFTFQSRGKTVKRKLPAIYLRRFKGGKEKYVAPAFPLKQRTSGALRKGEKVRRRIDARRERLTRIRFYTFPQAFVAETLLPDALEFIPERIQLEMRRALRRFNSRGDRALLGNNL